MGDTGKVDDPQLRIRQLERAVAALTKERDDLAKDVEQLCLSRGSHMFSSSYVASERIKFLESELKDQRQLVAKLTADRDNLQEDIWQFKASKKQSDEGWQQERVRASALEKDLDFYKSSSAKAISERDRASFDAQMYRSELDSASAALKDTRARLATQEAATADLRAQLSSCQQRLESEQREVATCRVQLRQQKQALEQQLQQQEQAFKLQLQQQHDALDLQLQQQQEAIQQQQAETCAAQQRAAEVAAELSGAEAAADKLKEELSEVRAEAAAARQQLAHLKDVNAGLQKQLHKSSSQVEDLQTLLEQTSAALVASQARLKETHNTAAGTNSSSRGSSASSSTTAGSPGKATTLQQEVAALKLQLHQAEVLLQQAAHDKLEVQLELSQAQADEEDHIQQLQQLQQQYNHCKTLLAQAAQQKVEALLQVASSQPGFQQHPDKQGLSARASASASPCSTPPPSPAVSLGRKTAAALMGNDRGSTDQETGAHQRSKSKSSSAGGSPTKPQGKSDEQAAAPAGSNSPAATDRLMGLEAASVSSSARQQQQAEQVLQLRQQLLRQADNLQRLLQLAHRYRVALQQLSPADIAAAAESGGSSSGSGGKARSAGRKGAAAGQAGDAGVSDPLARLAAVSQELEQDKQHLMASCASSQQQLEDLITDLLQQAGPSAASAPAGVAEKSSGRVTPGRQGGTTPTGKQSPGSSGSRQTSMKGLGGLAKLLPVSSSTAVQVDSPAARSSPESVAKQDLGAAAARSLDVSSTGAGAAAVLDQGLDAAVSAAAALGAGAVWVEPDVHGLHVAVSREVQLLAECCVAALLYIPKLTALSTLMQGAW